MSLRLALAGLLAACIFLSDLSLAEARDRADLELRTDAGVRLKMPGNVSATFTQHVRFEEKISRLYLVSPELALSYRPLDWWKLEAGYRYIYERDNDAMFQHRHRVFANTRFRAKLEPVILELRLQWQMQLRDDKDDGTPMRHILRTRIKATLRKVPVVNPLASVEMFQRLDNLDYDISPGTVKGLRFALGVGWILASLELNLRYYLDLPTHEEQDPIRHMIGIGGRFDVASWDNTTED